MAVVRWSRVVPRRRPDVPNVLVEPGGEIPGRSLVSSYGMTSTSSPRTCTSHWTTGAIAGVVFSFLLVASVTCGDAQGPASPGEGGGGGHDVAGHGGEASASGGHGGGAGRGVSPTGGSGFGGSAAGGSSGAAGQPANTCLQAGVNASCTPDCTSPCPGGSFLAATLTCGPITPFNMACGGGHCCLHEGTGGASGASGPSRAAAFEVMPNPEAVASAAACR